MSGYNANDPFGTMQFDSAGFAVGDTFGGGVMGADPTTAIFGSMLSGLGGMGQAGPSMATGAAYGAPVTVGGLSVNKQSLTSLAAAALLGAGVVWLLRR